MDFLNICKFFISNQHNIQQKQKWMSIISHSYKLFKINRQKLKLGVVVFEYKPLMYGKFLLKYDFNLVLSRDIKNKQLQLERTLSTFTWSWDFKSISSLLFLFTVFIFTIRNYTCNIYANIIKVPLINPDHLAVVLNQVFDLVELKTNNHHFLNLSSTLADLSIYLNLFS